MEKVKYTAELISGSSYQVYKHIKGKKIRDGRINCMTAEVCRMISAIKIEKLKLTANKGGHTMKDVLELEAKTKSQEEVFFGPINEEDSE